MEQNELLHRISNDDEVAFACLYRTYQPGMRFFFMRYVHAEALAEDLCQELFIKLWNNRKQLADVREFRPYLHVLARNLAVNALKRISVSQRALGELLIHYSGRQDAADRRLVDREYDMLLEEVLSRLPQRSREVFNLCREQSKSYDEAAKALGVSRNAIKNHMVSTLKVLRAFAEKQLGVTLGLIASLLAIFFAGH
ncbi:sigma-70 family RNA polymerase sigma factor [Parapedobacter sp. ISTM3]|uniref:RNA polymerase sigma-70 factor, ECF subfamily n=1 Tax=Parapedobacter luteus TaxID=623280 RepID=A0A1T5CVR5_9SPHI|nr:MULTISPECIES: sigma-70 family RNA polymerase sigma factor [Parapedobacter]MBK1440680.1 sigma-70 family RNA polymerase sigma factor [Parapedobacter sp. ISTM3]SKB63618.1 RNA polymerase sigma-70 factor, ECF subfamily [Parapedobacter luteus]